MCTFFTGGLAFGVSYGTRLGPISLHSIQCNGSEESLSYCKNVLFGSQLCPYGFRYGAIRCYGGG